MTNDNTTEDQTSPTPVGPGSANSVREVQVRERIYNLKQSSGMPISLIAMNVDRSEAYVEKVLKEIGKRLRAEQAAEAELARRRNNNRYEQLLQAHWSAALEEQDSANLALRIMSAQENLMGLKASKRVDLTTQAITQEQEQEREEQQATIAKLVTRIEELQLEAASKSPTKPIGAELLHMVGVKDPDPVVDSDDVEDDL